MSSDEGIKEEPISFNEEEEKFDRKEIPEDEDIIKILVATDLHLGYEQTTKRLQEDDSFRTFEEILKKAKEHDVDMILLGGDLFHEAKPPSTVINRCISLFRQYCLGKKDIKIEFVTDPELVFKHCQHKTVNYEDENLNVSIPVFSIHGNHDDPSYGNIGLMDVLSSTGLVNYFGKWSDVKKVAIAPIVIRKGSTHVALYGLSYMNDQRLSRLIKHEKFQLLKPKNLTPFNIFVLHQNRAKHSKNAFVPEDSFPDFIDLVIWGHEHECRIEPEMVANKPYTISQPGSSVATSLAKGESEEKFVGLLKIHKGVHKMEKLKLETVRPFVFKDMVLKEFEDEITVGKRTKSEAVEEFIDKYIENDLIADAAKQFTNNPDQPQSPLIRLRIFHTENSDVFETIGLSQKYQDVVANPNDMIVFRKCSAGLRKLDIDDPDFAALDDIAEIFNFEDAETDWNSTIEGGMKEFFSKEDHIDKLTVLSLVGLNSALNRYINVHDSSAIVDLTKKQIEKTVTRLMEKNLDAEDEIIEEIKHYRNERLAKQKEEEEEVNSYLNIRKTQPRESIQEDMDQDNGSNESEEEVPVSTRGRGRGRAKKANSGTTRGSARGSRARGRAARNQSLADL